MHRTNQVKILNHFKLVCVMRLTKAKDNACVFFVEWSPDGIWFFYLRRRSMEKERIRMWNGIIVKNIKWSKCIALWKFFFSCAWVSGVIVIISFYIIKTCRWIHPLQLQITRIDLYRLPVSRFGCVFVFPLLFFHSKPIILFCLFSPWLCKTQTQN